ncbi:DUF6270 domain-containing protein [Methanobrevibacter sp.]|uniref:DUF6270 domain-containing protein n=1 Tax=Methanobrevibacter sp. TaxID=66852 RepID=UPI003869B993
MKAEFSTLGSCSSRNIFNSNLNKNYKDYFNINHSIERVSMISLMSNSIEYDSNLINSGHEYDNVCVTEDLSKRYLHSIKNENFDYILLDTFFDVNFNVIQVNQDSYITESYSLKHTDMHDEFIGCKRISISDNSDEYFILWKKYCDLFFSYLNENSEDTRIILNCSRSVYRYRDNNSIIEDLKLKNESLSSNRYQDILDSHILENYDVEVLPFNYNTLLDRNHIFGIAPTHFESDYYRQKTVQLKDIIRMNELFDYGDEAYSNFRSLKRENAILKMKLYDLNEFEVHELRDENAKLKEEIDSILGSNSWKITKPLRNLKKL